MPMYDYKCPVCTRKREVMLKLADLNSSVFCQQCGGAMNRQLSAPFVRGDFEPYESPAVPGKWISGRREHEEHLKETGCRLLEPGETTARQRAIQKADDDLDKAVENTVEEFITTCGTEKREKLAAELEGGLDVAVVRQ